MTIFTPKAVEKKEDANTVPTGVVSEYKLLVEDEKAKMAVVPDVMVNRTTTRGAPLVIVANQRRHSAMKVCIMLVSLILMMAVILVGIMVYKHLMTSPMMYRSFCGVRYHENSADHDSSDEDYDNSMPLAMAHSSEFQQEVTIDNYEHETIEVPKIGDARRATVMHDFNKNITVIVDKEQGYCFIMSLNRTLVMPPRDFWDLLVKLKTGYYIPDVQLVRDNYHAVTPPIADLTPYGLSVVNECRLFDTYRLVRDGEPVAISKRSAPWCDVLGKSWCLGDAGGNKMQCIGISGCI